MSFQSLHLWGIGYMKQSYDVIVVGAGAAGLMAGASAGKNGARVLIIEHSKKIGEKIRISGGGRCNFTNRDIQHASYISHNPHFVKSIFAQYDQNDFIDLVKSYGIDFHEKTLGQLFCDQSSKQIVDMMVTECTKSNVKIITECDVVNVSKSDHFDVQTSIGIFTSTSLIIATGGLSIPQIGATDFGYKIAKQFSIRVLHTQPALVPLKLAASDKEKFTPLSGVSFHGIVHHANQSFEEGILITHRGLSGPAILQISSYMDQFVNRHVDVDLLPTIDFWALLQLPKNASKTIAILLKDYLPSRLINALIDTAILHKKIAEIKKSVLINVASLLKRFTLNIDGSEGYQKAEVTKGGVDTDELCPKTLMSHKIPGLFFIGEVVDVTGWLGGYNFQWAWSSGYVAGKASAQFSKT
jgi:predicted Rossmann fold flavoprotein